VCSFFTAALVVLAGAALLSEFGTSD